jgi:hypothetical protein
MPVYLLLLSFLYCSRCLVLCLNSGIIAPAPISSISRRISLMRCERIRPRADAARSLAFSSNSKIVLCHAISNSSAKVEIFVMSYGIATFGSRCARKPVNIWRLINRDTKSDICRFSIRFREACAEDFGLIFLTRDVDMIRARSLRSHFFAVNGGNPETRNFNLTFIVPRSNENFRSLKIPKYKTPRTVDQNGGERAGMRGASQSVVRSRKNITTIKRR